MKIYLSNSALYVLMRLMDIFNWWGMLILLVMIIVLLGWGVYMALSGIMG